MEESSLTDRPLDERPAQTSTTVPTRLLDERPACHTTDNAAGYREAAQSPPDGDRDNWAIALNLPSVWDLDAKIEWLLEGLIPLKAVTLISAPPATGKGWLAYAIADAVAHGRSFLGKAVIQRPVLCIDAENPLPIVKRNLSELGIERSDNLQIWGGWNNSAPAGPGTSNLVKLAREHQPVLIFDSLIHFHTGDEQSATDTRQYMDLYRTLANAGATPVVLHHPGKDASKKYRGSSDIAASVDVAYTLDGKKKAGLIDRLTLRCFKSRYGAPENVTMQFRPGQGFEAVGVPQGPAPPSAASIVVSIISAHPGANGKAIVELAAVQGVSKHSIEESLKTWPNQRPGQGREKRYYPVEAADAQEDPAREAA